MTTWSRNPIVRTLDIITSAILHNAPYSAAHNTQIDDDEMGAEIVNLRVSEFSSN